MSHPTCRALCVRWLCVVALLAVATTARAAPRMTPFLQTPGVPLGGNVNSATFCDASKRAVFRLDSSHVVAVDATGAVKSLGNAGVVSFAALMVCDRKDRIVIAAGKKLITLVNNTTKTEAVPADVRHMRVLEDGTVGVVDNAGTVYRYDGTTLTTLWSARRSMPLPMELDGKAEQILVVTAGHVQITDQTGPHEGPTALTAAWLDNTTVLFGDRNGVISKWLQSEPQDRYSRVAELPPRAKGPGSVFTRAFFQRAGGRIVVQRNNDGPFFSYELDAKNVVTTTTQISRIPLGRRFIATGDATFAVVSVNDRALVVDLTRSSYVVDFQHALTAVDSMAFSPDGRSLAMFGGDRDVIVASLIDRSSFRHLETTSFVRGPLRWAPDGTIFMGNAAGHVRWNLDGTVDERRERSVGFTSNGGLITITRDLRVTIDRGHSEQSLQLLDRTFGVAKAEVVDHFLVLRGVKRVEVYDLNSPLADPIVRTQNHSFLREAAFVGSSVIYLDEQGGLNFADGKTERQIDKIAGVPAFAISADTKRLAIANKTTITIYDDRGREVAKLSPSANVQSIAWSPDLRTLAVATRDGVELWTIPR